VDASGNAFGRGDGGLDASAGFRAVASGAIERIAALLSAVSPAHLRSAGAAVSADDYATAHTGTRAIEDTDDPRSSAGTAPIGRRRPGRPRLGL